MIAISICFPFEVNLCCCAIHAISISIDLFYMQLVLINITECTLFMCFLGVRCTSVSLVITETEFAWF